MNTKYSYIIHRHNVLIHTHIISTNSPGSLDNWPAEAYGEQQVCKQYRLIKTRGNHWFELFSAKSILTRTCFNRKHVCHGAFVWIICSECVRQSKLMNVWFSIIKYYSRHYSVLFRRYWQSLSTILKGGQYDAHGC